MSGRKIKGYFLPPKDFDGVGESSGNLNLEITPAPEWKEQAGVAIRSFG